MISTRSLIIVLVLLLLALQYNLWVSHDGPLKTIELRKEIAKQKKQNRALIKKNKLLATQVNDLKDGKASVQDLARDELGMVKPGERYYKFIQKQ